MDEYFWLLLGQSLFAMAVLAGAGAWALVPFAGERRPYLWLAAPLSGIGTLSLSLYLLYFGAQLTVPWAFAVACLANGGLTVWLWRRGGYRLPAWRQLGLGAALIIGGTACVVGTVCATAIERGEPTVLMMRGTDQFGYSHAADWLLQQPHVAPQSSPTKPYEAWLAYLWRYDTRFGIFLLHATLTWLRGTTALFSYDFAAAILLASGLLGFAGAFARRPLVLVALLAAVALSLWLRNARTGFFGKVAAYPGYLLVVGLLLETWTRWTLGRTVACVVLGTGFALCHNPLSLAALVGLAVAGVTLAVLAMRLARWAWAAPTTDRLGQMRFWWRGIALTALIIAPSCLMFWPIIKAMAAHNPQVADWDWGFVLSEAQDVNRVLVVPELQQRGLMLAIAFAAIAMGALLALYARSAKALGLFATGTVVVGAICLSRKFTLLEMRGLLYPLTLAGAALLVDGWRGRRSLVWTCLCLGLIVLLGGARFAQFRETWLAFGTPGVVPHDVLAQSEIDQLSQHIGSRRVDLSYYHVIEDLALLVELGQRGVALQLREPTWSTSVGYTGWPARHYEQVGDLLITPFASSRDPVLFSCPHWHLVRNDGVWIAKVQSPVNPLIREPHGLYWLNVDKRPVELTVHCAAAQPTPAVLTATTRIAAGSLQAHDCKLTWSRGNERGQINVEGTTPQVVEIVLNLMPGDNTVTLVVQPCPTDTLASADGIIKVAQFGVRSAGQRNVGGAR
jgi:hypothetical protein